MKKGKFRSFKASWADIKFSLSQTLYNDWLRLLFIVVFALWALFNFIYCHYVTGVEADGWFHTFLEFVGVAFIFLIVEYSVRRLDSGISDPEPLPLEDFIEELSSARSKLILFDTALETILLDRTHVNHVNFEKNLRKVMKKNPNFKIQILLINPESVFVEERAAQRGIETTLYKNNCIKSTENLKQIRDDIVKDIVNSKDRITIKEYTESPPFAMYSIDNRAYLSFYPEGIKTTDARQLYIPDESTLGSLIFQFYDKAFEEIWKDATEI